MNRDDVLNNPQAYRIAVPTECGGGKTRIISLDQWFLIPLAESEDTFLLDSGGWSGFAVTIRIDFTTGKCSWKPAEEWKYFGELVRVLCEEGGPA